MSKVIDAWNNADFEFVAAQKLSRFKRKDIRLAIRESRYALKLIDAARVDGPVREPGSSTDAPKVVTILHASLPNHTGGYTGRAQGLLKGLAENGLEVRAYTRPGFYNERVDSSAKFPFPVDEVDGVKYHHLPTGVSRTKGEFEYMFSCISWYREVFLAERPNIVHLRSTYLIALPAMIAAHQLGIPVLYEVSGLWELVYEGRGQTGRARRTIRCEDLVCEYADRIVSMNNSMANLLAERNSKAIEVGLVPNAVDAQRFAAIDDLNRVDNFKFDFGYVGSLVDYEGLDNLIEAIAIAKKNGRTLTGKIVGKGQQYDLLKEKIAELGLEQQIALPGPVSADQAVLQFQDVNIVVLPRKSTPATENVTPLKPFEAMAAGRPLLVSNVAALEEVSGNGRYAEVFQEGDPQDLANALVSLLDDRQRQEKLVVEARKLVIEKHNWTYVAKAMADELQAYSSVVTALPNVIYDQTIMHSGDLVISSMER